VAELALLSQLLKAHNALDSIIAGLIHRPVQLGHVGEFLAQEIFGVQLHSTAVHKGSDGVFRGGFLDGCSVDVKWDAISSSPGRATPYFTPGAGRATPIGDENSANCTASDTTVTCTDAGVLGTAGTGYFYIVRIFNGTGLSSDSTGSAAFTFDVVSGTP